MGQLT